MPKYQFAATATYGLLQGKDMLHSMRRVVDAIFYVLRNGVTWRALPLDFPRWQTVYHRFRRFAPAALFERLNAVLVALDRVATGRDAQPTAAIIDSRKRGRPLGASSAEAVPIPAIWRPRRREQTCQTR